MAREHLSSLNLIRVFEVAARRQSFKDAADELFVSPPAVSHQIKALEEELGVELFKRENRKISLTSEGKRYYLHIKRGLDVIDVATSSVRKSKEKRRFVINTLPNISALLLIPNIHSFQDLRPDLNIQVDSEIGRVDFDSGETHVAIRHQCGGEPDLTYIPLAKISLTPVCTKEYCEQYPGIFSGDFSGTRIIKLSADPFQWPGWQSEWGLIQNSDELIVNSFQSAMEAVKNHVGVAMGYVPVINRYMRQGDFLAPLGGKVTAHGEIFLAYPTNSPHITEIDAFRDWLVDLIATQWSD